jgi:hypothetical protein
MPGSAGALAALLALAGCGSVSVRPSGSGFTAEARPKDCAVEFLRNPPEGGYGELAELYSYYHDVVEPKPLISGPARQAPLPQDPHGAASEEGET